MILTQDEIDENARRDRAAQAQGYTSESAMLSHRRRCRQAALVASARAKLTDDEWDAVRSDARESAHPTW